jgi:CRP/FNR family cyclic AMP-dependent transcriptional regulator
MSEITKKLSSDQLELFLKVCHRRSYPAKTTIIHAGDVGDSLYYIVSGSVTVFVEDEEGHEIIVSYLNKGEFFGEMGLFEGQDTRSANIKAKVDCQLAEISYARFHQFGLQHPTILLALCSQLTERLRKTTQKVSDLAFVDVQGRIATALLDLCKQPDAMTHPDGMQIKITRQELGRIVGCTREMAGRVLKALEDQDLLTASGKTVVVFNTR